MTGSEVWKHIYEWLYGWSVGQQTNKLNKLQNEYLLLSEKGFEVQESQSTQPN